MKTCKMLRQQQLFIKGRIQLTRVNTNDNFLSSKALLVAKCSLHCAGGVNVCRAWISAAESNRACLAVRITFS